MDVIVNSVPLVGLSSGGIIAFQFTLNYDPAELSVTGYDLSQLIAAEAGSNLLDLSDPIGDSDGAFLIAVADLNTSSPEDGPGVLARITLHVAPGVSGAVPLTLTDLILVDLSGSEYGVTEVRDAQLFVETPCPTPIL